MDRELLQHAFQFVTSRGFVLVESVESEAILQWKGMQLSFNGPGLRIEASHDDRDGFDCSLVFLNDPGPSVSVGTLMAALSRDEAVSARSSREALGEQAQFIERHLDKLMSLPSDLLEDCRALRFYHAAPWRKAWGRAIQMDAEAIHAEGLRLERLRNYFIDNRRAA